MFIFRGYAKHTLSAQVSIVTDKTIYLLIKIRLCVIIVSEKYRMKGADCYF